MGFRHGYHLSDITPYSRKSSSLFEYLPHTVCMRSGCSAVFLVDLYVCVSVMSHRYHRLRLYDRDVRLTSTAISPLIAQMAGRLVAVAGSFTKSVSPLRPCSLADSILRRSCLVSAVVDRCARRWAAADEMNVYLTTGSLSAYGSSHSYSLAC
jgi:hypothetical protein